MRSKFILQGLFFFLISIIALFLLNGFMPEASLEKEAVNSDGNDNAIFVDEDQSRKEKEDVATARYNTI